ncbi:MAG: hypothetical protein K2M78_07325 [Lachnospiraceae bacterium]|nr:hypothetical protein [Lachnospiraceae bacterium]
MKLKVFIFLLALGFILTGCTTEEKVSKNNDELSGDKVVKFNIDRDDRLDNINNNYEKLYGEKISLNELVRPDDFFKQDEKFSKIQYEIDESDAGWKGSSGSVLYAEPGRIYFTTKEFSEIYDGLLWTNKGELRDDFDDLTKGEEVAGLSEEDAVGIIQNILSKYGITAKNLRAFPLSSNVLLKLSKEYMSDEEYEEYLKDSTNEPMKREFSEEDEAYLIIMNPCVGKNYLYNRAYDYGRYSYSGSLILAIVMRNKLAVFDADGAYEVRDNTERINKMLTLNEAEEKLNDKFCDMIVNGDIICRKEELTYIAVKGKEEQTYEFIPAYVFDIEYSLDDSKSDEKEGIKPISQTILLDAQSGNWIE